MHIVIDYPWYFLLFCVAAGALYSGLLYYVRFQKQPSPFSKKIKILLSALRFVSVALIVFLFFSPLVKRQIHEKEKPLIIVAQDNSLSPVLCADSAFYRSDYARQMGRLVDRLVDRYEVVGYLYGSSISQGASPDYSGEKTDMSAVIDDVCERYDGRNVGAMILSGDGICNEGASPINVAERAPFPIYTIALGDTSVRRDAAIADVRCNREVLLGSRFAMEVTVRASRLKGESRTLKVSKGGRVLFSKQISYSSNNFASTEQLLLDADKEGVQNYRVSIEVSDGEVSEKNNSRSVPVKVVDDRKRIAIIAAVPHPDVAAIKQALSKDEGNEVKAFLLSDVNGRTLQAAGENLKEYSLIVLHQLPSDGDGGICQALKQAKIPLLFVLGSSTDLKAFNALQCGLSVNTNLKKMGEVSAVAHRDFAPFEPDAALFAAVEQFPPLMAPFGDYRLDGTAQALLSARVGSVVSDQPLLAVAQTQEVRYAFIVGEGVWHWRMSDYQENGSADLFDHLMGQVALYTTLQVKDNPLRMVANSVYSEREEVLLRAEVYDENCQPTNTPDIKLRVLASLDDGTKAEQKEYVFNRTGGGYQLNLGSLPPGCYNYEASCAHGGKSLRAMGSFVVSELNLEEVCLTADHALLHTLAQVSGGRMALPTQLDSIVSWLDSRDDLKTVIRSRNADSPLLNLWWVLALIVLLFGAEWVIRKYNCEM